jgi:hypothetical protein
MIPFGIDKASLICIKAWSMRYSASQECTDKSGILIMPKVNAMQKRITIEQRTAIIGRMNQSTVTTWLRIKSASRPDKKSMAIEIDR